MMSSDRFSDNTDDKLSNAVRPPATEHDRNSSASPPRSPNRETPNFSRPLALTSPGSPRPTPLPTKGIAGTAHAANASSTSPRPLPSVPDTSRTNSPHVEPGRGSGLGTRIIDDRDLDDVVPAAHLVQSQSPRRSYGEDEVGSTLASDSSLLYASAPSTPLRVATELQREGVEDPEATIKSTRQEGGQHEAPERRATLALGEANREPMGSLPPRRAATMDHHGRGDQAPPIALPQKHEAYQALQYSNDNHGAKGLEHNDSMDSYVQKIVNQFGDEPKFPEPLANHNGTAPPFPEPQPHLNTTVMAVGVPESHIQSLPQRGHETTLPSAPSAVSFPIPSLDTSWSSYRSPTNYAIQASGGQSTSDLSHLQHTLIAGTNLQFEPFPAPYKRINLDDSPQTHAEARSLMDTSTSGDAYRPPPSSPMNVPPSSPLGQEGPVEKQRDGMSSHNAITVDTKSNGVVIPALAIAPTAPLRISKHTRTPPSSPGIPPGAAPPTPPSPSWSVSSRRGRQSTSKRASLPLPVVPPSSLQAGEISKEAFIAATTSPAPDSGSADTRADAAKPDSVTTSRSPSVRAPTPSPKPQRRVLRKSLRASGGATPRASEEVPAADASGTSAKAANVGQGVLAGSQTRFEPQNSGAKSVSRSPSRKSSPGPQSYNHPTPQAPPHPPPPPPPSDGKSTTTTTLQPHRHTSRTSQQQSHPRTLTEEKAQYNAIPPSSRSRYMKMLLAIDDIPMLYNLLASFFTWILLAGFILFPGTFTNLQTLDLGNGIGATLVDRIVHLPLFIVAFVCTGVGVFGMGYLWWKWMKNYIWLVNKIFLPGLMNSVAGVLSTIVNVYGVQHGEFNKTSIVTISVTAGVAVVCLILVLWYGVWMLGRVKKQHEREMGIEKAGRHGEGVWVGFKRKVGNASKRK